LPDAGRSFKRSSMLPEILEKIVAIPRVYDGVQRMAGREESYRRLLPFLLRAKGEMLLEAGAGTGEITQILDPTTRYTWLDNDPRKLSGFRQKCPRGVAVLGSVTEIPLAQSSMHTALCMAVSHHLTDGELGKMFAELARVCRKQFIFLDGVEMRSSPVSNFMWRYDRGSYPRTAERLTAMLQQHFVMEETQQYSIFHHYLLFVGRPIGAA
jgi:ubiquinone/menaquinone biosynthesis C-methylase UbiE